MEVRWNSFSNAQEKSEKAPKGEEKKSTGKVENCKTEQKMLRKYKQKVVREAR